MENKSVFDELFTLNVNEHVEKKNTGKCSLSYLSWSWAWAEVKRRYPTASYEIKMFDGKPYSYDELTGYMCFTSVTIEGVTHDMWLPVMDSHNDAMLSKPYEVKTRYGSYTVEKCTMFDVNKTIMRCLTKNLAMFGLGLYIYAGEDLPEDSSSDDKKNTPPKKSPAAEKTTTPTPAASDNPEVAEATKIVNEYITKNLINKSWIPTAKSYIESGDLEGLKRVIDYTKKQIEKAVEEEAANA